ncbi:hypothetical protein ABH930_000494 [Kitasatospora sp. GAS204A]|uniref:hypothetical protein n=1 Tax=unclassified Kitasatospora TaxID=2633591 RepID=UPI0024731FA7|nr:hypothetical protein [Kitasatospora sp. GAS204B]MDH6117075.1 hypothetical protein [Kitasatospora sp. GAS204B]
MGVVGGQPLASLLEAVVRVRLLTAGPRLVILEGLPRKPSPRLSSGLLLARRFLLQDALAVLELDRVLAAALE